MIFPLKAFHLVLEFAEVICSATHVEYSIVVGVLLLKEFSNLYYINALSKQSEVLITMFTHTYIIYVVAIHLLETTSWKRHC